MFSKYVLGLGLSIAIAALAMMGSELEWGKQNGLNALTLAIVLGMLVGNSVYPRIAMRCTEGVNLAKAKLLRLGIILYGFRLTFQQVSEVGLNALVIDVLVVVLTFGLGLFLGRKWLKLHPHTTLLISAGASICGAAAVLATAPVVKGKSNHIAVAVATVVIFGTLGLFLYPLFYSLGTHFDLGLTEKAFGIYVGSTVHEVAQVVAIGNEVGQLAANNAVITKMVRVMLLAPFLLWLSWQLSQRKRSHAKTQNAVMIPWFAIGFVVVIGINSADIIPSFFKQVLIDLDTWLLTIAMAALGLTTHFSAIKQAGLKPLLLALILFLWLVIGGGMLNLWLG